MRLCSRNATFAKLRCGPERFHSSRDSEGVIGVIMSVSQFDSVKKLVCSSGSFLFDARKSEGKDIDSSGYSLKLGPCTFNDLTVNGFNSFVLRHHGLFEMDKRT